MQELAAGEGQDEENQPTRGNLFDVFTRLTKCNCRGGEMPKNSRLNYQNVLFISFTLQLLIIEDYRRIIQPCERPEKQCRSTKKVPEMKLKGQSKY